MDSVKGIDLDAYVNKEKIGEPMANSEIIANYSNLTQEKIDNAYENLKTAVNNLDDGANFTKASALPVSKDLPDIFTFQDGSKVKTSDDWDRRQEEIAKLYKYYMYGVFPDSSEKIINVEYLDFYERNTWWGETVSLSEKENLKILNIIVSKNDKNVNFVATVTLPAESVIVPDTGEEDLIELVPPKGDGGYPVLIVIGFLGDKSKNYLNENGYAVIEFDNNRVATDDSSRSGAFYELYPYGKSWHEQTGVLSAWSWGVSKIIDVIEEDAAGRNDLNISPLNTIVTGVSRNGKAAAVAGAFDKRIKVTVPASSGAGGIAAFRYK
ncbi:MAG: hypothetical protein ACOCRO_08105, partial [Halanaerobiales bacterium]